MGIEGWKTEDGRIDNGWMDGLVESLGHRFTLDRTLLHVNLMLTL